MKKLFLPLAEASAYTKDSTDYACGFICENGVPARFGFPGGYVRFSASLDSADTRHFVTDHLGNIRSVFTPAGAVEPVPSFRSEILVKN